MSAREGGARPKRAPHNTRNDDSNPRGRRRGGRYRGRTRARGNNANMGYRNNMRGRNYHKSQTRRCFSCGSTKHLKRNCPRLHNNKDAYGKYKYRAKDNQMTPKDNLHTLSSELILHIVSFLDIPTLCRLALCGRAYKSYAYNRRCWRFLDLHKYQVNGAMLFVIGKRIGRKGLVTLNLRGSNVNVHAIKRIMHEKCGSNLVSLELHGLPMTTNILDTISNDCTGKLKFLGLSMITTERGGPVCESEELVESLLAIIKQCTKLEVLVLDSKVAGKIQSAADSFPENLQIVVEQPSS